MSGSRVRGPTSALTEFLRERGINNESLSRFRRNAEQQQAAAQAAAEAAAAGDIDTADAALAAVLQANESNPNGEGSSNGVGTSASAQAATASPARGSPARSSARRPSASRRRSASALNYEESDDTEEEEEEEEEVVASSSRSRAAASGSKANGKRAASASTSKAAASKKQKKKHDDDDDDDDFVDWATGGVPGSSRSNHSYAGRTPGKIDYCAGCKAKFTITKYTKVTDKGAYCHKCGPLQADSSPAPKPKKKRMTAAEKRQAQLEELKTKIPSLQSMCISIVSDHIEDVEALGDIGPHNIDAISKAIARSRCLNENTVKLFLSPGLPELSLYDCSQLDGDALASFGAFAPDLEVINLQMCGRLVDTALDAWAQKLKKLRSLELFGPFLVRVEAWYRFFEALGPRLRTFKIRETPRFDLSCVEKMVKQCPNITELGLAQIGKLDDKMLAPLSAYQNLTYLDISDPGVSGPGIMAESLKDESVIDLLSKVGSTLRSLNISGNSALTDEVVTKGIAPHCRALISLACSGCDQIKGKAFAHLWNGGSANAESQDFADGNETMDAEPGPSTQNQSKKRGRGSKASLAAAKAAKAPNGHAAGPPSSSLVRIDLSRALLVDDDAVVALVAHSGASLEHINLNSVDLVTERGLGALAGGCRSVVTLDLSFCRALDDSLLMDLMKIPTLQKVFVWGCNRVTDFVTHPRVAIIGKERTAVV